jgi:GH35 family endo-1,4-beta-xylanase
MNYPLFQQWTVLGAALALLAMPNITVAAEPTAEELLAGAAARIEQHRKADATIQVVDATGKPLPGAKIDVEQTRHAFLFGCNIFPWGRLPDEKSEQAYRQHFADLLNYATLPFYWWSYERRQGEPNHKQAEEVARWCRQHGILTKGHPLAWNHDDARWYPDDSDELHRLQLARIDDCVKRFAGLIDRWDVVNEATLYDRDEVLKRAPKYTAMWKKVGQIELIRECFVHARQANPKATLLINDYCTDPRYNQLIDQIVDQQGKRLYDVIGIQSHMHTGAWPTLRTWRICEQLAPFGVPLHFTETTILSGQRGWEKKDDWPSTAEGEAYQAREVVRFYTLLFSHPAVEAITWWDFTDLQAWQRAPAGFLRKDMTPKPAYDELKKLIKGQWWTSTQLQAGAEGTASFRGFLGDYRITVRAGQRAPIVKEVSLTRGEGNRWMVKIE